MAVPAVSPPAMVAQFVQRVCPQCWPYFNHSFQTARITEEIVFSSWFRTVAENHAVSGQPTSQHLFGVALDFGGGGARQLASHLQRLGWTVFDEGDHWHVQLFPKNPFFLVV